MFAAERYEMAQITLSAPVKLAFNLFMVDPENVRGDDLDSARLHFQDLLLPVARRIARVMEFAHDRKPRLSVANQVALVGGEIVTIGGGFAHLKRQRLWRGRGHSS